MTQRDDTIVLGETKLLVLTNPQPSTRDGNWRIRARVLDGQYKGEEVWLVSNHSYGPWGTPDTGFV